MSSKLQVNPLAQFSMEGRVALVTGASSGLGAHAAVGLAEAGADLTLVARRADRLEETRAAIEEVGRRAVVVVGDVAEPDVASRAVEATMDAFGHLDVLLNNAGVGWGVPATRETPEQFRRVIDINLSGAYWMAQACGRVMGEGSSIINVGSILGTTTADLPQAAYAASKAGLAGLTRDLASQWTGRKGIRVNTIAPGFFETEMTDLYPQGYLEEQLSTRVPMGRGGRAVEFVCLVLFLASPASSYVTGAYLPVDGGILVT